MAKPKRINTRNLTDKIDRVTKERISKNQVINLDDFRKLKPKEEPSTVLLIDDDETMRKALKRILENDGYNVVSAADASELASVLDGHPIDLIILDVGLPWINGLELAQMMKEQEDLKKVPLVFISALASEDDVKKGFRAGASDYIKKPFEIEQIRKTVRTLLELSK